MFTHSRNVTRLEPSNHNHHHYHVHNCDLIDDTLHPHSPSVHAFLKQNDAYRSHLRLLATIGRVRGCLFVKFGATMNSLSFISRQLDVLASSSSAPCTPPSTPTRERASSSTDSEGEAGYSRRDGVAPPLKRTRTWSARSFLIPSPAQTQQAHMYRQSRNSPSRTRKRSGSTPANAQFRTESSTAMLLSPTESKEDPSIILATSCFRKRSSNAHEPQTSITPSPSTSISAQSTKPFPKMRSPATSALRRTYIVRMVILAVQWLCATWDDVKRLFRHNMVHTQPIEEEPEAETSGDEKESDDDLATASCQAARAEKHKSNPSTLLVTRAPHTPSKSKSLKPSPLGQTSKLPTVKLIPPNSLPTDIERPPILDSAITLNDQVRPRSVSPSFVAVGTNAPKTPFHTQKTLVLDLDETLIHSTTRPLYPSGGGGGLMGFGGLVGYGRRGKSGHMVEVVMNGRSTLYHVYKRPFVDYFLRKVWTCNHKIRICVIICL